MMAFPGGALAEQADVSTLKVAYIYHFLNLTQWPDQENTLVFGLYGESEIGQRLQSNMPKRVGTRNVIFLQINPRDLHPKPCHAVYIPAAYQQDLPEILSRVGSRPTLTISDVDEFTKNGGMIGFVVVVDKLRFDINQRVSTERGLRFSAKLLELARSIQR